MQVLTGPDAALPFTLRETESRGFGAEKRHDLMDVPNSLRAATSRTDCDRGRKLGDQSRGDGDNPCKGHGWTGLQWGEWPARRAGRAWTGGGDVLRVRRRMGGNEGCRGCFPHLGGGGRPPSTGRGRQGKLTQSKGAEFSLRRVRMQVQSHRTGYESGIQGRMPVGGVACDAMRPDGISKGEPRRETPRDLRPEPRTRRWRGKQEASGEERPLRQKENRRS